MECISRSLRTDISQKFDRLPLNYFDTTSTGNILSRVTNDVDTIGQTLNQSVGTLVTACAMFLGSLIMMLRTNWVMALAAVLAAVAGFGLMMLIVSRSQGFFRQQQMELGALNGHIEETYSGHTVVKAYGGEADAKEQFRRMNRRLYDSAWKSQFLSGLMQPLMGFVGNLGYVAVCVTGAVLTLNGVPVEVTRRTLQGQSGAGSSYLFAVKAGDKIQVEVDGAQSLESASLNIGARFYKINET